MYSFYVFFFFLLFYQIYYFSSGSALITSLLDNQKDFKTHPQNKVDLTLEDTVKLVKDSFTACGERDIYTGDSVDIYVITKDDMTYENFNLKAD
jgi:20S proteasome subunit beta 6